MRSTHLAGMYHRCSQVLSHADLPAGSFSRPFRRAHDTQDIADTLGRTTRAPALSSANARTFEKTQNGANGRHWRLGVQCLTVAERAMLLNARKWVRSLMTVFDPDRTLGFRWKRAHYGHSDDRSCCPKLVVPGTV